MQDRGSMPLLPVFTFPVKLVILWSDEVTFEFELLHLEEFVYK